MNRDYYVYQIQHLQDSPMAKPVLADNGVQMKHFDSLKIIEKAINFLRRKFDCFKHKKPFDELSKLIKILGIWKNEYGIQDVDEKFVIWKKKRNERWKEYASYWQNLNLIKTKLIVNWKKRRRRIDAIVNLLEVFLDKMK
jgi:hypothetical protein